MRTRSTIFAFIDIVIVSLIFSIFLYYKPGKFIYEVHEYLPSFLLFIAIWIFFSVIIKKYSVSKDSSLNQIFLQILYSNLLIIGMATTLMYLLRIHYFSRMVVFGTILCATLFEIIVSSIYYFAITAKVLQSDVVIIPKVRRRSLLRSSLSSSTNTLKKKPNVKNREEAILVEIDQHAFEFMFSYARIDLPSTMVISTTSDFNINMVLDEQFESIVNLRRINDIRYVNKFFETANAKLPIGGLFLDFVESKNLRKKRILRKYPPILNYIAYTIDFIIKRILPKFAFTKGIYFFLTRGQNRVFTKAETYGRLYSCGFEIIDEKLISNHLFFVARKVAEPFFPIDPTYGPLIKLERIGYKGKIIKVYKLRTMHPYAEYLQEYVYKTQGLQEGGKFRSDFRVSTIGKILRTFWLDELPMLVNLLRREIKIVGVRPLSQQYFNLYDKEFRKRRINYRPGLIPPFYVDNPKTLEEIIASEKKYLDAYDKHPILTDLHYFLSAVFNILFKKYRSN